MELTWLRVPQWENYPALLHGFSGRRGGKSIGAFAGLNLSYGVGDDARTVSQNVCDLKSAAGIHEGRVVTMRQVHGDAILEVEDPALKDAGEADGMITRRPSVYLGVLTADCVPLLLIAPKARIAAAVHAGWRGTAAGIAAKALRLFDGFGAAGEVEAALGPSIGGCCYEVGDDVIEPIRRNWGPIADACAVRRGAKSLLDLRKLNRAILEEAGMARGKIFEVGPCTSCARDEFYSYRRDGQPTGRQMGLVGWQP